MSYATTAKELNVARKKQLTLRSALRRGLLSALGYSSKPSVRPALRLLYLHNVFDDQIADFTSKIRYLMGVGEFVTTDEVMSIIRRQRPLEGHYFHLSFDDGFRNVITNAFPVLKDLGVPATFFVPTAYISANYHDTEHYCLNITRYPRVIEMATWEDLAKAQESGLEIASHTRHHARFSDMSGPDSEAKLEDEICGSKAELEAHLDGQCRYISWPYGRIVDADTGSLGFVKTAGYEACFGAFRGEIEPGKTDPFYIPRHHFEADWPLSHLKYFAHGGMEKSAA